MEYRFLELPEEGWLDGEWHAKDDLYVTFRKPIGPSDDANMKAIPRKQRAMVRKAIDRGLTSRTGQDVDGLHAVYAESVRNLGTPVFSRSVFSPAGRGVCAIGWTSSPSWTASARSPRC